jgi:hypothetical protein
LHPLENRALLVYCHHSSVESSIPETLHKGNIGAAEEGFDNVRALCFAQEFKDSLLVARVRSIGLKGDFCHNIFGDGEQNRVSPDTEDGRVGKEGKQPPN